MVCDSAKTCVTEGAGGGAEIVDTIGINEVEFVRFKKPSSKEDGEGNEKGEESLTNCGGWVLRTGR